MRVGTYNVLGITGFPKEAAAASLGGPAAAGRISHFVEAFSALETDILHLEEGVTLAMAQQLADGMGRYVATFASPMDWSANGLGQGCTGHVISRFPILESRTFSHHPPVQLESPTEAPRSGVGSGLADGGVVFSRTAGAALLDVGGGTTLWAVTLHLHPGDVPMRNAEAELVAAKIPELLVRNRIFIFSLILFPPIFRVLFSSLSWQTIVLMSKLRIKSRFPQAITPHVLVCGDFNCTIDEAVHDVLQGLGFVNALDTVGGGCQQPTMDTLGIEPTLVRTSDKTLPFLCAA